ncbi:hypothetical protein AB1L12_05095 [Peribacillus frigoritolerans]|jgi:hypothetical protein
MFRTATQPELDEENMDINDAENQLTEVKDQTGNNLFKFPNHEKVKL